MFYASVIASYIIGWCYENNIAITNLKLQKLLYFTQGFFYKIKHQKLISDDFYAWQLGPVIPEIYYKYSIYSASNIPRESMPLLDNDTCNCLNMILSHVAFLPAWQLVEKSHQEDPWKYNYEIFGNKSKIPFESIKNYYGAKA